MAEVHVAHTLELADPIRPVRVVSACRRLRVRVDRRHGRMVTTSELELASCALCREIVTDQHRHAIEAG